MDTQGDESSSIAVVGGAGGVGGGTTHGPNNATRKRFAFARVVPEQGKKRVNYGKGDARRIMEEAVSLCEAMTLGYEVVFHGRRRSFASKSGSIGDGVRGLSAEPTESARRDDADAQLDDSQVAYIARSKRDVAEHFGVAWSTMQPRLVGKIGAKNITAKASARDLAVDPNAAAAAAVVMPKIYGSNLTPDNTSSYVS
eukprot:jgi/Undpi1/3851/HiC_scaffold_16.g07220.m1